MVNLKQNKNIQINVMLFYTHFTYNNVIDYLSNFCHLISVCNVFEFKNDLALVSTLHVQSYLTTDCGTDFQRWQHQSDSSSQMLLFIFSQFLTSLCSEWSDFVLADQFSDFSVNSKQ